MKWLGAAVVLASLSSAHAASVAVDPGSCGTVRKSLLTAAAKLVGMDWPEYRPFMCLYPIKSPTGSTALFLLALNADKADAAGSLVLYQGKPVPGGNDDGNNDPVPLPMVIGKHGKLLAKFPESVWFPRFDPATTDVYFSKWYDNFPHKFKLRINDPTVGSPGWPYCPPPFMWNAHQQKFVEQKGNLYAKCPR